MPKWTFTRPALKPGAGKDKAKPRQTARVVPATSRNGPDRREWRHDRRPSRPASPSLFCSQCAPSCHGAAGWLPSNTDYRRHGGAGQRPAPPTPPPARPDTCSCAPARRPGWPASRHGKPRSHGYREQCPVQQVNPGGGPGAGRGGPALEARGAVVEGPNSARARWGVVRGEGRGRRRPGRRT